MKLKILAFGAAKDIVGAPVVDISVDGSDSTVGELKAVLLQKYPDLATLVSFLIAVNSSYAYDETHIASGDEIAIIPPTSGG